MTMPYMGVTAINDVCSYCMQKHKNMRHNPWPLPY